MKKVTSLWLGTAAGLVAITGAQAADLPVKAKAVEYVKVCSLYGAGFYYIPGTDTCMRIGGGIRLDVAFNGGIYDAPFWQGATGGANSYNRNYYQARARLNLTEDTRTQTEWGVLRTYANIQFDWSQDRENIAGGFVEVDYAFIQWAGFQFGKAVSNFDPQWTLARPIISSGFLAGSYNATGIFQGAYTWQFGNGVSATLALEDATPYRNAGVINAGLPFLGPFGAATAAYGGANGVNTFVGNVQTGTHVPDIVANIRVDQAWGSLHFGAAAHEVHGTYYAATTQAFSGNIPGTIGNTLTDSDSGHPSSTWGYAFNGALELKNLPTGTGDSFKIQGTWAQGATKYVFGGTIDVVGGGRFAKLGGGGCFPGKVANVNTGAVVSAAQCAGTIGMGYLFDGVYNTTWNSATLAAGNTNPATATGIALPTAWEIDAYFEHYWTPQWKTSVFGSYSSISYGSNGNAYLTAAANRSSTVPVVGTGFSTGTGSFNGTNTGNFNFSIAQVGTRTAWSPVTNLTFSAEFIWSQLQQNQTGVYTTSATSAIPGVIGGKVLTPANQNLYNGAVQILRTF